MKKLKKRIFRLMTGVTFKGHLRKSSGGSGENITLNHVMEHGVSEIKLTDTSALLADESNYGNGKYYIPIKVMAKNHTNLFDIVLPESYKQGDTVRINFEEKTVYINNKKIDDIQIWKDDFFPVFSDYSLTTTCGNMMAAYYGRDKYLIKADKLKNYVNISANGVKKIEIYGNTVDNMSIGENCLNLFNPRDVINGNQILPDENGWYDVTIDNSKGTTNVYRTLYTKPNNDLKTDTEYYCYLEIALNIDDKLIICPVSNSTNFRSQFKQELKSSGAITTISDFTNSASMMRGFIAARAGMKGRAKFRIAVYKDKHDYYVPYGTHGIAFLAKGKNLIDFTKVKSNNSSYVKNITMLENGYISAYDSNINGRITSIPLAKPLKQGTPYFLSFDFKSSKGQNARTYLPSINQYFNYQSYFVPTKDTDKIGIYVSNDLVEGETLTVTNLMLNEGTQKINYVPYIEPSEFPVPLGQALKDDNRNLFNYTEPNPENNIADRCGWFDITIDNTTGMVDKYSMCMTKVNSDLKTDTEYYIYVEVAEKSGEIILNSVDQTTNTTDLGQFKTTKNANSGFITTRSDFSNCSTMLCSYCYCEAGKSGHIKFRIAVYETQKDKFEPYVDKNSTIHSIGGLRKTDKYTDKLTVDFKNKTAITERDVQTVVLDSSWNWKISENSVDGYFRVYAISNLAITGGGFCNLLKTKPLSAWDDGLADEYIVINDNSQICISLKTDTVHNLDTFKSWLKNNNPYIIINQKGITVEDSSDIIDWIDFPFFKGEYSITLDEYIQPSESVINYLTEV